MASRKSPRELGAFLFKRGLWILFIEVTLLSMAYTFSPGGTPELGGKTAIILQVLWAIGASMVLLAGLQFAGERFCMLAGAAIIVGHNLLDYVWPASTLVGSPQPLWVGLHAQMSAAAGPFFILNAYPLLPWLGVMLFGFGTASLFRQAPEVRDRLLRRAGWSAIAAFVLLRAINIYGDPQPWQASQLDGLHTVMAFLNTNKYPPSLLYLLMTLGPAAVLCSYAGRVHGVVKATLVMFGRVPFFFYVAHFYLAHLMAVALGLMQGFTAQQMMCFFIFNPKGFGLQLGGVYLAWLLLLALLYLPSRAMARLKARRSDWWLSYL